MGGLGFEKESLVLGLVCGVFQSWAENDNTSDHEYVVVLSPERGA